MRQNIGGLAGLLAVIGLLVHTQAPPAAEKAGGREGPGGETKAKPGPQAEGTEPAEGPWIATRGFFPPTVGHFDPPILTQPYLTDSDAAQTSFFMALPK